MPPLHIKTIDSPERSFSAEHKFRSFLLNPNYNSSEKKQILSIVLNGKVERNTLNFLLLLLDKNRLNYLPEICTEYSKISDHANNILTIQIITAIPLEQESINLICEKYKKQYKAKDVKAMVSVDPSLVGGIKVSCGDKLLDATLKEKLMKLQSTLISQS